jgi:hypothetical protein
MSTLALPPGPDIVPKTLVTVRIRRALKNVPAGTETVSNACGVEVTK